MKKILMIVAVLMLASCANLKFQWAASYQTDNLIADLERARQPVEAPIAAPGVTK
jgi:hypothetical protein